MLTALPNADVLIADRGYDSDWYREALTDKGITPCIPGRKNRRHTVKYDERLYKQRNLTSHRYYVSTVGRGSNACSED